MSTTRTRRSLSALSAAALLASGAIAAEAHVAQPAFPPPGGANLLRAGASAADPSGVQLHYSGLRASDGVWFAPSSGDAVTVTLQDGPRALLVDATSSALPRAACLTGVAGWDDPSDPSASLTYVRVRLRVDAGPSTMLEVVSTADGASLRAWPVAAAIDVTLRFEVDPRGTNEWIALNQLPQERRNGGAVESSFDGGLFWVGGEEPVRVSSFGATGGLALGASDADGARVLTIAGATPRGQGLLAIAPATAAPETGLHLLGAGVPVLVPFRADEAGNWVGRIDLDRLRVLGQAAVVGAAVPARGDLLTAALLLQP